MTEFAETAMRSVCRNPRCRSKLPAPVSNPREAFCVRGCHSSFYKKRCRVCEDPIEQPKIGRPRLICKKAACINAFASKTGFGCYADVKSPENSSRNPIKLGIQRPLERDSRSISWRIVAGPPEGITANAYHCAIVGTDE